MIESGTPAYWRATLALSLGSILIFANLYTPQPLLPLLRVGFGVTELQASLCVTISTLTLGLSLLIYGPLSDAIGRRPLMLVTMALATLCTLTIPLATDFSTLLALRALQGLFLGGCRRWRWPIWGTSSSTTPCCWRWASISAPIPWAASPGD